MAGSTKKRKATSDFKRIKAKVGKKALKPANVTDTSFKSASVSVKNQAVDFSSHDQKLLSERGKSIQDLTTQLNHPAAAVRTSAIRGLSNVVDSHSEYLKAHLSVLLPAVAKCCVDEDEDVRQLGLSVLRNILTAEDEQVLRPFLALLIAYVASALNSLDKSTRLDGGRAVNILSTTLPSLMGSQAETLLPAFVGLLADYSRQRRPESATKKRKKASDSGESGKFTILQSLVDLLRTMSDRGSEATSVIIDDGKPDIVFVPGGRSVNALLVAGREQRSVRPISSISELASFVEGDSGEVLGVKGGISVSVATDIISKLRDIYIELSQRGGTEGTRGGMLLSAADIEELALLNEAIRLFWNVYCRDILRQQAGRPKEVQVLRKAFTTLLSLMMETFPVWQQSPNADLTAKCTLLNADMCATLMDIGGFLEADSRGLNWTKVVLDYLLPRLDSDASIPIQGDTIVDVLFKLLLLRHDSAKFTLAEKTRRRVLEKICAVFFPNDVKPDVARLASSRRAALLIVAMLKNDNFVIENGSSFSASLRLALKSLTFYLRAWRGDFLQESRTILSALHDVTRRLDLDGQSTQDILECLKNGMAFIFEAPKRSKRKKGSQGVQLPSPIFELYSEEMQRQALGLLVLIGAPSEATINGLSYLCARCSGGNTEGSISSAIADAMIYAVHSVRRSMSMQAYLSFIVNSIGINNFEVKKSQTRPRATVPRDDNAPKSSVPEAIGAGDEQKLAEVQINLEMTKASEAGVLRAARSLVRCGGAKVLTMIDPVLNEWLAAIRPASELDPSQKALRFRAASSLCAILVLEMDASALDVSPDVARNLIAAVCDLFAFCFSRGGSDQDSPDAFEYLMQPMLVSVPGAMRSAYRC